MIEAGADGASRPVPHPFPYQGSKRRLAQRILERVKGNPRRLLEPFAGSAAVTLAAAASSNGRFCELWINDALPALAGLWRGIVEQPEVLADAYALLWECTDADTYLRARADFNRTREPSRLLYLLARCVKAAVRFNAAGGFNQAADKRRRGAHPTRMRRQLLATSALLQGRARITSLDFADVLAQASREDFVYLDPPYEGTSTGPDRRYAQGLARTRVVAGARSLLARGIPFALSYDGSSGDRRYGATLEAELGLSPLWLDAGTSSQGTLSGQPRRTVEALYVSAGRPTRP